MAEPVDQHLSGAANVSPPVCVCESIPLQQGVIWGREMSLTRASHTHTCRASSIRAAVSPPLAARCLLSQFIWIRPVNRPLSTNPPISRCCSLSSSFRGQIKATPGRFTAFTAVFYSVVFLPSGRCQVMWEESSAYMQLW